MTDTQEKTGSTQPDQSKQTQAGALPLWRKIALTLIVFAIVVLVASMILKPVANRYIENQLTQKIESIAEANQPLTFNDLLAQQITQSSGQTATPLYTKAIAALPAIRPDDDIVKINQFYRRHLAVDSNEPIPEKMQQGVRSTLQRLNEIIVQIRQGGQLPIYYFDFGLDQGRDVYQTRMRKIHAAFYLISTQTLNYLVEGKPDMAAQSACAMIRLLRVFDISPTLKLYLQKIEYLNLACDDLEYCLQYSRPSTKNLIKLREVLSVAMSKNSLSQVLTAERIYQLELAHNLLPQDVLDHYLSAQTQDWPGRITLPKPGWSRFRLRYRTLQYLNQMDQLLKIVKQPWPQPIKQTQSKLPSEGRPPKELINSGAIFIHKTAQVLSILHSVTIATAVVEYENQHQSFPDTINQLVPGMIAQIPKDPFSGELMNYSVTEDSCVIYSVGENGTNDGGMIHSGTLEGAAFDIGIKLQPKNR